MGRNEFISISDSKKFTRAEKDLITRHTDWASCAFLGAREG